MPSDEHDWEQYIAAAAALVALSKECGRRMSFHHFDLQNCPASLSY